jgi:DNA-binding CsgD family transcriptional regulator/catechol 2,3-dioxygenase-like lactoylglutathione lyase family enzyme
MTTSRDRGRPPHPDVLTPAEWRVAEGVRHGLTNRRIAERQGVTLDAVKFHVGNVLSKLGLRRRSDLRRWSGVRADSNLAILPPTQGESMQRFELGQVARSVRSIDAATAFFRDVVGLPHLYSFGKLAFFDCAGVRLLLSEGDDPGASLLYFRVAAIHAAQAQLEQRGAHFISAPHLIHRHADGTEEWMAFFNDNEQRPLAIMAQVSPAATSATTEEKSDD